MGALSEKPPLIAVMGPTASGKTGLAVALVERFPVEIISVDSVLVYRGLDIGSARPDTATLKQAPHRLIDICEPGEAYSAARFRIDALAEIEDIHHKGRIPLLVGGTMLYFRALLEGLSDLPEADPVIRAELEQQAAETGWPAMHEELNRLDPVAAAKISPNDPQRIQRALEVIRISGQPISALQIQSESQGPDFKVLKLVICPEPRQLLHRKIEQRFRVMIREGLVDEVKALRARGDLDARSPAMRSVGYRQAWQWLEGQLTEDEWQQKAIVATRQLAKRQLTWLRREKDALWYNLEQEGVEQRVFDSVREFCSRSRIHGSS